MRNKKGIILRVKLLATIGPSSFNQSTIGAMEANGVDLFKINLSHTKINDLPETIENLQSWSCVPICLDSEGAQVRNQYMINEAVAFKEGDDVKIHPNEIRGDSENISFAPHCVFSQLIVGDLIYVDFHAVTLKIIEKRDELLLAKVISSGVVGSNKAVNINREIKLDPITKKDSEAFHIGKKLGITSFALSFTNSADDVKRVREIIGMDVNLISKIESIRGVLNLDEILPLVDEILIDRGDLSREVAIEKIPFLQRRIISKARSKNVPVYVATNLLESMTKTHAPTRAEVNDVASTLLMGADGLVLAAETAIGQYPIDAVKMINLLVKQFTRWTPESSAKDIIFD
jgi:pyruvate kinase